VVTSQQLDISLSPHKHSLGSGSLQSSQVSGPAPASPPPPLLLESFEPLEPPEPLELAVVSELPVSESVLLDESLPLEEPPLPSLDDEELWVPPVEALPLLDELARSAS
jgi:hypothetical protein